MSSLRSPSTFVYYYISSCNVDFFSNVVLVPVVLPSLFSLKVRSARLRSSFLFLVAVNDDRRLTARHRHGRFLLEVVRGLAKRELDNDVFDERRTYCSDLQIVDDTRSRVSQRSFPSNFAPANGECW